MFAQFTDRARKALALANQEGQHLDHGFVGTEHLLLGLMREGGGVTATTLRNLGLDLVKLRAGVEKLVPRGPGPGGVGRLPQRTDFKTALEHAREEARARNDAYLDTQHLLLGLLRENECVAAQVLMSLGLNLCDVRREVLDLVGCGLEDAPEDAGGTSLMDTDARVERPVPKVTEYVRRAMALADQEARRLNHEVIGVEHLLLGLAKEGTGVAATALRNLGLDARRLRLEIERLIPCGPEKIVMGRLPITPQVKDAIEYAREETRLRHHAAAGTGHVLLGLLGEAGGVIAQILASLGVRPEEVRQAVMDLHAAGFQDSPSYLEDMAVLLEERQSCGGAEPGPSAGAGGSFQDLPVWLEADELVRQIHTLTAAFPQESAWTAASQLRKAAFAIPPAIAEAHRCPDQATARWLLHAALAALADLEYLVLFSARLGYLKDQDGHTVKDLAEEVDRELRRWCASLKQ